MLMARARPQRTRRTCRRSCNRSRTTSRTTRSRPTSGTALASSTSSSRCGSSRTARRRPRHRFLRRRRARCPGSSASCTRRASRCASRCRSRPTLTTRTRRASRCVARFLPSRCGPPLRGPLPRSRQASSTLTLTPPRARPQVIGEIATFLKALLQKRSNEFVDFMTNQYLPGISCPPEASAQFMTALQDAPECVDPSLPLFPSPSWACTRECEADVGPLVMRSGKQFKKFLGEWLRTSRGPATR